MGQGQASGVGEGFPGLAPTWGEIVLVKEEE